MKKWLMLAGLSLLSGCSVTGVYSLPPQQPIELPPARSVGSFASEITVYAPAHFAQDELKQAGIKLLQGKSPKAAEHRGLFFTYHCPRESSYNGSLLLAIPTLTIFPGIKTVSNTCTTELYENGTLRARRERAGPKGIEFFSAYNPLVGIIGSIIPGANTSGQGFNIVYAVDVDPNYLAQWRSFMSGELLAAFADYAAGKPLAAATKK